MTPRLTGLGLSAALGVLVAAGEGRASPYRQPVNGDVVVTAYYDHGGERDWACVDWTYGGHHGTDIAIIGRFEAQDQGRDIAAAQAGRVIRTHDGEFDRCTTADCAGGGGFGNYVYLQHADGQVTIYGHMRQGSVRVGEGQEVACGDILGQVGSSGFSTGPHCHFEVRVNDAADDPFAGQCGGPLSYWVDQGDHRGLPSRDCAGGEPPPPPPPPPPPTRPDMHLSFELAPLPAPARACDFDDCRDFIRDGASGGVFDAWVGEAFQLRITVSNQGDGGTQGESAEDSAATLQYELPAELTPVAYAIETDWPAKDRSSWSPNDAQDNPANPPLNAPPGAGEIRLNGFGAGESKRLTLTVTASRTVLAGGGHLPVRAWIKHLKGYYGEKTGWDDGAEVNDGQTYNGGDLKVGAELDVFDPTAFLFDSPDAAQVEGWRRCAPDAVAGFTVNTTEHCLASEIVAAAPCIEGPRTAVPLAGFAGVRLQVRQRQTQRRGVFQWTTEATPDFAADRSVSFQTRGGEAFEDLWLAVPWDRATSLTRLRLLPVPDAGSGDAWFDLAEIRLTADAPPAGEPGAGGGGGSPPPGDDPDDGVPGLPPGGDTDATFGFNGPAGAGGGLGGGFGGDGQGAVVPEEDRRLRYEGGCTLHGGSPPARLPGLLVFGALALLGVGRRGKRRSAQVCRANSSRTAGGRSSIFPSTNRK